MYPQGWAGWDKLKAYAHKKQKTEFSAFSRAGTSTWPGAVRSTANLWAASAASICVLRVRSSSLEVVLVLVLASFLHSG